MTPCLHNCNNTRNMGSRHLGGFGRAALGLLRPLRGSGFALGQPDRFATGESRRGRKVGRGVPPSRKGKEPT